jgi:hypothetical protein
MDKLDISMKKQIQNELIRSRNSMITEIRREIFEKMTYALRSQGVYDYFSLSFFQIFRNYFRPDKIIDMHIFELDCLLSQMIQDCLNSLPAISLSSSNPSISTLHITPQTSSVVPPKKTIEFLYITPSTNKKPAPLAPHHNSTLDHTHRLKSASNNFLTNQNPTSSSHTHKFQRVNHKNTHMKMHRSEDDIIHAVQSNQKSVTNLDDGDSSTLCEDGIKHEPSKVQFELQTSSLPARTQIKHQTPPDTHYATTRIINHKKQQDDDEELTWPQQPIPVTPSTQSNGIKKFVRNSLKLFIAQPQQHKRSGK